jgi:hypothetical protein
MDSHLAEEGSNGSETLAARTACSNPRALPDHQNEKAE